MTVNEFNKELASRVKELEKLACKTLPTKIGALAKRHYQDNFRKGGYVDNGLKPWRKAKRQSGKSSDAKYKTLLSRERNLMKGVESITSDYRVKVCNDVPYAAIHNWGGTITHKRKIDFKTMSYNKKISKSKKGVKWSKLAVGKKLAWNIKIPQRQFLGESRELNDKIRETVETEFQNILNK